MHEEIIRKLAQVAELYHRLVLIVAPPSAGKTAALQAVARISNGKYININLELSQRLLELTERQRALKTPHLLREIVEADVSQLVLLDNLELLFDASLQQDPLRLLQGLSRNRTVVAAWNGSIENGRLIYAQPDHPEYRAYPARDLVIVSPRVLTTA
jgi:hypothetical protein